MIQQNEFEDNNERILIILFSEYDTETMDAIKKIIEKRFGKECLLLEDSVQSGWYHSARSQYNGSSIVNYIRDTYRNKGYFRVIGLMEEDCYTEGLNFIFGLAIGRYCFVATIRYHQSFYNRKEEKVLYLDRLQKEVVHELGHTFQLRHCHHQGCVMHFSNSLADTDMKSNDFCTECRKKIKL